MVVIAFFAIRSLLKPQPVKEEPVVETPIEEVVSSKPSPRKSTTVETPVPQLSYTEAVTKYKNSRIQFVGENCQATPANQSFKVGTSIMLDNRTPKPATISIGSSVYLVEAYGYQVVNLSTEGMFTANCNGQKNVLTLSVQK